MYSDSLSPSLNRPVMANNLLPYNAKVEELMEPYLRNAVDDDNNGLSCYSFTLLMTGIKSLLSGVSLKFRARRKFVDTSVETNLIGNVWIIYSPFKDEAQTALFKDLVRTAL